MFGHESLPSMVFEYGAKAPVEAADVVDEQMRLAHRYRNALVDLERKRRGEVDRSLETLCPELKSIEADLAACTDKLESGRKQIRQINALVRTRMRPPDRVMDELKKLKSRIKTLWARRKELRRSLFDSPAWKQRQEEIDAEHAKLAKKLRGESGLYWGTYLHVEQSMSHCRKGAPPKFMRWNGDGHLATQIQHGMTIEEAFSGADLRLAVDPVPPEAWQPGGRHLRKTRVRMRVQSDEKGDPVWAVVPIVYHRPMPEDAQIKWVHLIRRRIACSCEWRIQFVLARERGWAKADCAETGTVGIDVGWRKMEDGSLRIATWLGDDASEGELRLPADWLLEMDRVEGIQSIRDRNFTGVLGAFCAWMKMHDIDSIPWIKEATKGVSAWRSPARLAALILRWRENRFAGDEDILDLLETWRQRDRHLYEFEANLRDQLLSRRTDIYRNFAAEMRRKYATALVKGIDYAGVNRKPDAECDSVSRAVREHSRDACLSSLIGAMKHSFREVKEMDLKGRDRVCPGCGKAYEGDRGCIVECAACGKVFDQDVETARVLVGLKE